jgi:acyl-CoA thioester hydrolase
MKIKSVISTPEIRFVDIDVMGHVNNAVYLSYFEQARMRWFESFAGKEWDWNTFGILLARNEINYREPVLLNDHLQIETWCSKVGNKSLEVCYEVFIEKNGERKMKADGMSVLVCFDYHQKKTITVPEHWRNILQD